MDNLKENATSLLNNEALKSYEPSPDINWKSYVLYSILAGGCVLPWYALIGGVDYFQYRYPDTFIIRILAVAYLGAWLLCFVLLNAFGRQYSPWTRISVGLSVAAVSILVIPVMDAGFISGEHGTTVTYYVTIAIAVITGCADAVAQGSLLAMAAEFPHRYMQAIVVGAGASGVVVFIVRLITRIAVIATVNSMRYSAVSYFAVCAFLIIICLSAFVYVHRMPVMGYYSSLGLGSSNTVRVLLESGDQLSSEMTSAAAIASIAAGESPSTDELVYMPMLRSMEIYAVAVFLLSVVTLSIFPGLLAEDMYSPTFHKGWYPLLFVGTFVLLDLIGRLLSAFYLLETPSILLGGAFARLLILIPCFVLSLIGPKIFHTEVSLLIITGLLGLTNGFLYCCLAVVIPKSVSTNEAQTAGIAMALVSVVGCVVGASLSWVWTIAT